MKPYDFSEREPFWQKRWRAERVYEPSLVMPNESRKPFYNLMMFPYPSAEGLHVGNMYAFTGSDIYGRMKRMQGYDVFEPIGLDGFGIHSENYALKIGTHPVAQAATSEKRFYEQLERIGNGFAWEERLETYAPNYYRWTQWVFVKLWEQGLVYRKKQSVNWCPSCKTVLADEQVEDGKCERCDSVVERRDLEQWFFRITKYAHELLTNLDTLDWAEKVKIAQRRWIGESEGARIKFQISNSKFKLGEVEVFTTRPDTLFGVTFLVVSPELAHGWVSAGWKPSPDVERYIDHTIAHRAKNQEEEEKKPKTGVFSGLNAVNPVNQELIPVWVSDYVLAGYGTGAIMAVPAHDARDFEFAKKFDLPIRAVEYPAKGKNPIIISDDGHGSEILRKFLAEGPIAADDNLDDIRLFHSGNFSGMSAGEAIWKIAEAAGGRREKQYRLRDWLISRQRYWGAPIPMIHCDACAAKGVGEQEGMPGWYAVREADLPVELPMVENFRPTGSGLSPLASVPSFHETTCPKCGGKARRETDVCDTFLDSAWYYLRYPSVPDATEAWNPEITKRWVPVDMYIGGAEHSVLHLLYVRFVALALRDAKLVPFGEPFKKFRAHGLLIKDGAKMSKSKGNVVNPDEYIARFGADALRTYLMFLAPFEQGGDFRDQGILGVTRFLDRVLKLRDKVSPGGEEPKAIQSAVHRAIKKVTGDIESLQYNTAISALMILLNEFEGASSVSRATFETFLKLLAPFAPHLTEEVWMDLGNSGSVHLSNWPTHDERYLVEKTFELIVQVNGKLRGTVRAENGITEGDAVLLARSVQGVPDSFDRAIFVPNKLVNFVVKS